MRQLFTCLVVVFLFAAALPSIFTANHSLSQFGQPFGYGNPPADYTDYVGQNLPSPVHRLSGSQVAQVRAYPTPFHLPDPIA